MRELRIGARVAKMRSAEHGRPVDLVSIIRHGRVYRVVLADTAVDGRMWTDVVSEDGEHIFVDPINLDLDTATTERQLRFARCLQAAGLKVYVQPGQRASDIQLEVIGGRADLVAVVCKAGKDDPACKAAGVTELPTAVIAGARTPGLRPRSWLEAAADCK